MANIEEIKNSICTLTPEELEGRGVIRKAKTGYICPLCGNGEGKDGTGIDLREVNGAYLGKCFKCGAGFDNFKLLGLHYQLDHRNERDFIEICKRACEDFNIPADFGDKSYDPRRKFDRVLNKFDAGKTPAQIKPPPAQINEDAPPDPVELDMIQADIALAQKNLDNLPENARRGLSLDTLRVFGCGFIGNWTSPKSRIAGTYSTSTPRLIIPTENHYLARLTVPVENFPESQREYIHEKAHAGSKEIFNASVIETVKEKWFLTVTEGEIDAMSLWQAYPTQVVAVGGVTGYPKLIAHLKKLGYGYGGKSIRVLIAFDPDDAGRKAAAKFKDELIDAGIPATAHFLSDEVCKLDFNDILREKGTDAIEDWVESIYKDLNAEFEDAKNEIATRQAKKLAQEQAKVSKPRTDDPDVIKLLFNLPFDDVGNGRRIALVFGDKIRYETSTGRWLIYEDGVWNFNGKTPDALYPLVTSMKDILKKYQPKDGDAGKGVDIEKSISRWGKARTIRNAIDMAKGVSQIRTSIDRLDQRPLLLNVANGTIDLATGLIKPHDPKDLLTKKSDVVYNPAIRSADFEKFMIEILPDEITRRAVLRFLGYCLTGDSSEEKVLFIHGGGGNGKSTLLTVLTAILGKNATNLSIHSFLHRRTEKDPDAPTPEFNKLVGARLASVSEIPKGKRLDSATFKNLTGRDSFPFRNLNCEGSVNVRPTHKFIFSGNDLPRLDDPNDDGLNRRLMIADFPRSFFKEGSADPTLKDRLLEPDNLTGALTILVEECLAWQAARAATKAKSDAGEKIEITGLLESQAMKADKKAYLTDNDWFKDFLADNCVFDEDGTILRKDFLERIKSACPQARLLGVQEITRKVEGLDGVHYQRTRAGYQFTGIGWNDSSQ